MTNTYRSSSARLPFHSKRVASYMDLVAPSLGCNNSSAASGDSKGVGEGEASEVGVSTTGAVSSTGVDTGVGVISPLRILRMPNTAPMTTTSVVRILAINFAFASIRCRKGEACSALLFRALRGFLSVTLYILLHVSIGSGQNLKRLQYITLSPRLQSLPCSRHWFGTSFLGTTGHPPLKNQLRGAFCLRVPEYAMCTWALFTPGANTRSLQTRWRLRRRWSAGRIRCSLPCGHLLRNTF